MSRQNKVKINLFSEFATRDTLNTLKKLMTALPDPDEILAQNEYDYSIYRDLLTDPHLTAAIQQRKMQVMQMDWEIEYNGRQKDLKQKAEEIIKNLAIDNVTSEILNCIFFGMSVQEIYWGLNDQKEIVPVNLMMKPQDWFIFGEDGNLYLRKMDSGIYFFELGKKLPPFKFIIHRYHPTYINPYGDKILSRCYWPVTFKRAAVEYWQDRVERFGSPFLIGYYPSSATEPEKEELMDQLENMIETNVAVIDEKFQDKIEFKEPPKYDIGGIYDTIVKFHNREISKAVLTVTLTTETQSTGSYKAAEIHKELLNYIGIGDKKIVETGINRLLEYWTFINWGHTDAPKLKLIKKQSITEQTGNLDETLNKMGVDFTKKYFKKRYNLEDEDFQLKIKN